MDEEELEKLREEKLDEMQEQSEEEREEAREQQKESIKQEAYQHMTQEAISRLGNVRTARPELAHAVSAQIARLGKSGRIDKVDDESLKEILRELQKDKDQNQGNISFRR